MATKIRIVVLGVLLSIGLLSIKAQAQIPDSVMWAVPNPFATSTEITIYDLTNDTVTFRIYNRWGSVVADFFEDIVLSGTLTVTFNADTLPNDIYHAILVRNGVNHGKNIIKQGPTNVNERAKDLATITVHPNPTTDRLIISTDLHINTVELFDMNGKKVLRSDNGNHGSVDVRNLDAGMYLLHLTSDNHTYITRVIKN